MKKNYFALTATFLLLIGSASAQTAVNTNIAVGNNLATHVTDNPVLSETVRTTITVIENGNTTTFETELPINDPSALNDELQDFDIGQTQLDWAGKDMDIVISRWVRNVEEQPVAKRPLLGVYCESFYYGYKCGYGGASTGAKVTEVIPGTAAEKYGFQVGDIITSLDDMPVNSAKDLVNAVRSYKSGDKVKIHFTRNFEEQRTKTTLGDFVNVPYRPEYYMHNDIPTSGPWVDSPTELNDDELVDVGDNYPVLIDVREVAYNGPAPAVAFLGVGQTSCSTIPGMIPVGFVQEGSAADAMGLRVGDQLASINDRDFDNFSEFSSIIREMNPGDEVHIQLMRDNMIMELSGRLGIRGEVTPTTEVPYGLQDADATLHTIHIIVKVESEEPVAETRTEPVVEPAPELPLSTISVAPNPSNGQFRLDMDLAQEGQTKLTILDVAGRLVHEENLGTLAGVNIRQIDISKERPGTYLLVVTQGDQRFNLKVVKQ